MAVLTVTSPLGADLRWLFPAAYTGFLAGPVAAQGPGITVPIAGSSGLGSEGFAGAGYALRFEGPGLVFAGGALTAGAVGRIELLDKDGEALPHLQAGSGGMGFANANSPALALAGADTLLGGAGADRFVFAEAGWGYDQVCDFDPAAGDRLDFRGSGVTSFARFERHTDGANTALIAPDGSRVDLYGVAALAEWQLLL